MRKSVAVILLLLLLIPIASAQFENAKKVEIKAVAVTSGENPTGAVIDITVIVTPGDGKVFVSTSPFTEIDMQGSAQLAALTACDLLGIDFTKYDFFYTIEADAPIVGGPSAGGVMTVATIAALKDLKIREDVFMTGMIYPDGFIGPVGGLTHKLEAAAENGGKIFLVPKGQLITYVEEQKVKRVGIINIVTTETREINLAEYGKKLGIDVYEVETVNDALKFYTGYEIEKPELSFNISEYSPLLKKLALKMEQSVEELEGKVSSEKADELIKQARKYYEKGMYYTATSRYFEAKIYLRHALYTETIKTPKKFDDEVEKIKKEIEGMKSYLESERIGVNTFQLFAAAQERIGEAEDSIEKAKNAKSDEDALYYLAYAKERVESAKVWLSILNEIKKDYELSSEDMKKRAEFYINQAGSIVIYASSLSGNDILLSQAYESLGLAKRLYKDGFYAGSSVVAVDAITQASLSIELRYGSIDGEMIKSSEQEAKLAISEAEKTMQPVLPVAYFEFAKTSENKVVKVMYYKLSQRLAKLLSVMSEFGSEREIVRSNFTPPVITTTERSRIKEILSTPGFEAIAAITAISIALGLSGYKRR
jgi:uncharacterized protein